MGLTIISTASAGYAINVHNSFLVLGIVYYQRTDYQGF